jgi:hypothetical protein
MLLMPVRAEINAMEEEPIDGRTTRAGQPCRAPRPAPTLRRREPPTRAGGGKTQMSDKLDEITVARAMLMQPLLRLVSRHIPPAAMMALRADLVAMRDDHAAHSTRFDLAMAEACDMALADLMIDGPAGVIGPGPSEPRH